MQTKLTLRLESELIKRAKEYARRHGKSLSQIVADYFRAFTQDDKKQELSPITRSLIGILEPENPDRGDYKKYLREKYL